MTSTQEPNRPALSHFPLLSWDVVLAFVYFRSKASKFAPGDQDVFRFGVRDELDSDNSDINFVPEVKIKNARQRAAVREKSNFSRDEDNLFADEPRSDCRIPAQITCCCGLAVAQKSYAIKSLERAVLQ